MSLIKHSEAKVHHTDLASWHLAVLSTYYDALMLLDNIKSVLGRVRNCVGKQALHCEMVASSYVHQPNHSYANFMFGLHSDLTRAIVVADVLHSVWSELPHQGSTLQDYS